jgi:hypothetical protein
MTLPKELSESIEAAKRNMDLQGEPPLPYRIQILRALGNNSATTHENEGYYKRFRLARACVLKSLHFWENAFPENKQPHYLLEKAEMVFANQLTLNELEPDYEKFKTVLDNLLPENENNFVPIYAGFACWAAVAAVLYDGILETPARSEFEVPPEAWDSSFYSSLAFSGGAVWEENVDNKARAGFWIWYLDVAVPEIWNLQPS